MNTTGPSAPPQGVPPCEVIFGSSPRMLQLQRTIEKVAPTPIPVLLGGESGTGKDVIARLLHQLSPFSGHSFVRITCPCIPESLLEGELFGYEEGSFTGATESKPGRLEFASGGTLFLDEISELAPHLQAKLLEALQDGQFHRVGANQASTIEFRLICATNRPIDEDVRKGNFRSDLYFRINGISLELPPLRERACDIPLLVDYFLRTYARKYSTIPRRLSNESLTRLTAYHWPGNIRELEHLIQRYLILADERAVLRELTPKPPSLVDVHVDLLSAPMPLKMIKRKAVQELEKQMILRALEACGGNRKMAARALKISYRGVLYKLRQCGIPPRRPR